MTNLVSTHVRIHTASSLDEDTATAEITKWRVAYQDAEDGSDDALGDYALLTEGRNYGRIEHYIEWLAEQADIPARSLLCRPQHIPIQRV